MNLKFNLNYISISEINPEIKSTEFYFTVSEEDNKKEYSVYLSHTKNGHVNIHRTDEIIRAITLDFNIQKGFSSLYSDFIKKLNDFFEELREKFDNYGSIIEFEKIHLNNVISLDLNKYAVESILHETYIVFKFKVNNHYEFYFDVYDKLIYDEVQLCLKNQLDGVTVHTKYLSRTYPEIKDMIEEIIKCDKFRLKYLFEIKNNYNI